MAYIKTEAANGWTPPKIKQLQEKGQKRISFNINTFSKDLDPDAGSQTGSIHSLQAVIIKPSGGKLYFDYDGSTDYFELSLNEEGEYIIRFNLKYRISTSYGSHSSYLDYKSKRSTNSGSKSRLA